MDQEDTRTMHDLVRNALGCQDGVNLSWIVYIFAKDVARLRVLLNEQLGNEFSTTKLNQHPVCIMYTSKLESLCHAEHGTYYRNAQEWCDNVLKQEPGEEILPLPVSQDAAVF
jgi:hypothetical protein